VILGLVAPALAIDLKFAYEPTLEAGERPSFTVTAPTAVAELQLVVEAGGKTYKHEFEDVAPGRPYTFDWAPDPTVTQAVVHILCTFADGNEEEIAAEIAYTYAAPLSIDLAGASADRRTARIRVPVTGPVESAEIVAYGAHRAQIARVETRVGAGPGPIELPWPGDVAETVLLEVTLRNGPSWTSFEYSPWFLDIPHQDVLFETDRSAILAAEEPKLRDTLAQLEEVLDKYGAVVPVQLYISGCTDTVGDPGHNLALSRDRARAIAAWLRAHGYDRPIWYHGFGEGWLAISTGDGVDNAANRRAVYVVGASPPGQDAGVPAVSWTPL
jgi:outer membrane protein OmpA-like peptidoglycan-associated protein